MESFEIYKLKAAGLTNEQVLRILGFYQDGNSLPTLEEMAKSHVVAVSFGLWSNIDSLMKSICEQNLRVFPACQFLIQTIPNH